MGFAPHTPEEIREMLAAIGVGSIADLFAPVPQALRAKSFNLPVRRTPSYCSGCPHNVSTLVLPGQVAWSAPGCHVFATGIEQPERHADATFQLGGEGLAWIGLEPFGDRRHVVQNHGDGALFHSSYANIRFAVAAGAHITFRILYNGAVANTGAQEPVGQRDGQGGGVPLQLELARADPLVQGRIRRPRAERRQRGLVEHVVRVDQGRQDEAPVEPDLARAGSCSSGRTDRPAFQPQVARLAEPAALQATGAADDEPRPGLSRRG